jgi:hypothetical protein
VNSINLQTASDAELEQQIINFRTTMLDSRKSATEGEMNFGDAVFLMEAAFNYYHGFTDGDYSFTQTDSIYFPVDYNNLDVIGLSALQQIFKEVNNAMLAKFESLEMANKKTIMFDLNLEVTNDGYQLLILMTSGILNTQKAASPEGVAVLAPFGPTDYWYPGGTTDQQADCPGKCGAYAGTYVGKSDATFEQEKAARAYRRGNMSHCYFADVETHSWLLDSEGLFYGMDYDCIDPEQMNQHYQAIGDKITYWYNYYNVSSTKQFADINIISEIATHVNKSNYLLTVVFSISYGQKKYRSFETDLYNLEPLP